MRKHRIKQGDRDYPTALVDRLGDTAPSCLYTMGDMAILRNHFLGLICSIRCPGNVVIKTLDAIRALRDAGVAVIGGFHSPMERECLDILLRGGQPVVLCPARRIAGLRIGQTSRQAVKNGRLLILSSFADNIRRTTALQAMMRNDLVAGLASALWVPHATPGGKTWPTIRSALERQQPVFTFATKDNGNLLEEGVRPFVELDVTSFSRNKHVG